MIVYVFHVDKSENLSHFCSDVLSKVLRPPTEERTGAADGCSQLIQTILIFISMPAQNSSSTLVYRSKGNYLPYNAKQDLASPFVIRRYDLVRSAMRYRIF